MGYTKLERILAVFLVITLALTSLVLGLYFAEAPDRVHGTAVRVVNPGSPTAQSPATDAPAGAARTPITAGYAVRGKWAGGFDAELVVTNLSSQPVMGWTVQLQLPQDVTVTRAWAADASGTASSVTLRPQPWNTYLGPGAAVRFGFTATGPAGPPRSCTVNGSPC